MRLSADAQARSQLRADPELRLRLQEFLASQTVDRDDVVRLVRLWEYPPVSVPPVCVARNPDVRGLAVEWTGHQFRSAPKIARYHGKGSRGVRLTNTWAFRRTSGPVQPVGYAASRR